jgi:hypothetical protein
MTTLLAVFLAAASPPAPVSGPMLCKVQHSIRHRNAAWSETTCDRVAVVISTTFNPLLVLAIAVNESDLRETATRRARRGVYDAGLMGVRCRLAAGQCTNGPARGHTLADLQDPVINIQVGASILEQKKRRSPKRYLQHYNGGTRDHGYAERVHTLQAALKGRRERSSDPRVNKLAQQIVEALR